ncbi:S-methyl-5-thioribose kinase [Cytobacillus sp. IB215316]|uniref:S-methyl-5-thioribose kinase n=1 Tax=Cytobacillus sp. IB215316 TaxID=3097354 RepID=UPI002A14B2E5|nr:S-methyl-5-thioribose kinase [Cytobacillus sp. IB215316]MDX8362681.1 S-methyl-5-thioribose kinase [Cytobacillus sp. IB215316]
MSSIQNTNYQPLTEKNAISLAQKLNLFPEKSFLTCKEIGDGNLNLVFRIVDERNNKGIIIKQALPYAKVIGESWPLTLKRATIESHALLTFASYCPEHIPKVYYTDDKLAVTVMEDLSHLDIVRKGFINKKSYPSLSTHIGTFLAKTLFFTSDYAFGAEKKKQLQKQFVNPELCRITEDLVFTNPFFNHDTNNYEKELQENIQAMWNDSFLKLEVAKLKKIFLTQADGIIHGDLHTGSIIANEEETRIIDTEFSFCGPIGFDMGIFFANLILQILSRKDNERNYLSNCIEDTWDTFNTTFVKLWKHHSLEAFAEVEGFVEHILTQAFADAVGFAGCEMIRRTIGLAHVEDLDRITPHERKIQVKSTALEVGRTLIVNRQSLTHASAIQDVIQHSERRFVR